MVWKSCPHNDCNIYDHSSFRSSTSNQGAMLLLTVVVVVVLLSPPLCWADEHNHVVSSVNSGTQEGVGSTCSRFICFSYSH